MDASIVMHTRRDLEVRESSSNSLPIGSIAKFLVLLLQIANTRIRPL